MLLRFCRKSVKDGVADDARIAAPLAVGNGTPHHEKVLMTLQQWLVRWYEENRRELSDASFEAEWFPRTEGTDKPSSGVYFERDSRGVHVTAWSSGEAEISTVDYEAGGEPSHRYLAAVAPDELADTLTRLRDWATDASR